MDARLEIHSHIEPRQQTRVRILETCIRHATGPTPCFVWTGLGDGQFAESGVYPIATSTHGVCQVPCAVCSSQDGSVARDLDQPWSCWHRAAVAPLVPKSTSDADSPRRCQSASPIGAELAKRGSRLKPHTPAASCCRARLEPWKLAQFNCRCPWS